VANVPGGQLDVLGDANARDLSVGQSHRPTPPVTVHKNLSRGPRRRDVVDRDELGVLIQQGCPSLPEFCTSPALGPPKKPSFDSTVSSRVRSISAIVVSCAEPEARRRITSSSPRCHSSLPPPYEPSASRATCEYDSIAWIIVSVSLRSRYQQTSQTRARREGSSESSRSPAILRSSSRCSSSRSSGKSDRRPWKIANGANGLFQLSGSSMQEVATAKTSRDCALRSLWAFDVASPRCRPRRVS